MSSSTSNAPAVMPCRTMQGHTERVQGVVHLPGKQRIITCSDDSSLRLWDLESGTQIGKAWQDEGDKGGVRTIALSPGGDTVTTGSDDGAVKLWDVMTGKVVTKWAGHAGNVLSVCWSAGGKRVLSGSSDGTARTWDVMSDETVLTIETGHVHVWAAIYSPDQTKFATGGFKQNGIKIWDTKTGELLATLKHNQIVFSLAWTPDGKKLISTSYGPITIFDTATWQEIAILEGHTNAVWAISLSCNNRLLASASDDNTARLWNLDTNLPVGPPLHHEHEVTCAAFSADAKVVVTGCEDKNAYAWDVHAILKEAGLDGLLPNIPARKSLKSEAMRPMASRVPHGFFDGVQNGTQSSASHSTHPRSTRPPFLERFSSLFHHFHYSTNDAAELQQRPRWTTFSRGPPIIEVPAIRGRARSVAASTNHTQHHSPPQRLLTRFMLCLCCLSSQQFDGDAQPTQQQEDKSQVRLQTRATSSQSQQQQDQSQDQVPAQGSSPQIQPAVPSTSATPSSSRPDGLVSRLFSLFRSQPRTDEDIPRVVEVAAMDDKGALFVVEQPQPNISHPQSASTAQPGARPTHSLLVRLFAHLGLYLCCKCNHQRADSNPQPTQQQEGQSQDPVQTHATSSQTWQQQAHSQGQDQAHASSSQTQPAPSTSTTPASRSHPDLLISRMSSLFRPQTHTNEEIELSEFPSRPRDVEVAVAQGGETCLAPAGQFMVTDD